MKQKYRRPIVLGATPLPTDDGISIIFGGSQGTFGSDYTIAEDAWEEYGWILVDLSDAVLANILKEMDDGDLFITYEEIDAYFNEHPELYPD